LSRTLGKALCSQGLQTDPDYCPDEATRPAATSTSGATRDGRGPRPRLGMYRRWTTSLCLQERRAIALIEA